MRDEIPQQVSRTLTAISSGQPKAAEELLPLVYEELRRLASAKLAREAPGHTLQPTALVHEAYLRLIGDEDPTWENRRHFFGAAALAMRRILIDRARKRGRIKHGGGAQRVELSDAVAAVEREDIDMVALDVALTRLEALDKRMSEIVNLRYFVGLSIADTAKALGVSPRTVDREWVSARAWLYSEIGGAQRDADSETATTDE